MLFRSEADLTLWLDLPLEESLRRRHDRRPDRIEASGASFLARVAGGFAELAGQRGWQRVDARQSPEAVSLACQAVMLSQLTAVAGREDRGDG